MKIFCTAGAIALALGLLAIGTGPVSAQSDDDATQVEQSRSATPADESAHRVRSIRRNEYFYQSYGRRDLFSALVTGEFEPQQGVELVDVNASKLVGVMWGPTDRFALVEDGHGNGFILRVGDRVQHGRVVAVQEQSLVASINLYGITSRIILRLEDRKDQR
ncbi:MAG TPA: hypothetical protein VKA86_14375 [Candidatus Krumholzibacteria bacterium]|nr:hypothetical protein [Candidatus Krumholzibacteria bacterium]